MDQTIEWTPFVSVGIIMKNEGEHIASTLSFLINQAYPKESFEIIIADGGSVDGSISEAMRILGPSGIAFQILDTRDYQDALWGNNFGHSFSRNVILDHLSVHSEFVAFTDADCRVDNMWLVSLVNVMLGASEREIWAGGPRRVETQKVTDPMELMMNYYFTSSILALGNPAFTERRVKYLPSIAGYNSIYRRSIFDVYRFDTEFPFNTDDIELNFRLTHDGYVFLCAPRALVYHRMDPSIWRFIVQMFKYGKWAGFVMRKHCLLPRLYVVIALAWVLYLVLSPVMLLAELWMPAISWYFLWFLGAVLISGAVFIENIRKMRNLVSLWVFLLVPSQVVAYGWWVLQSLRIHRKKPMTKNIITSAS